MTPVGPFLVGISCGLAMLRLRRAEVVRSGWLLVLPWCWRTRGCPAQLRRCRICVTGRDLCWLLLC